MKNQHKDNIIIAIVCVTAAIAVILIEYFL